MNYLYYLDCYYLYKMYYRNNFTVVNFNYNLEFISFITVNYFKCFVYFW